MGRQVTIIGAGANGAGCIAVRAQKAGYHVVFADAYAPSVRFVESGYEVKSVGLDAAVDLFVTDVEAHLAHLGEQPAIEKAIAGSEAVFLAVGRVHHTEYAELIGRALDQFLSVGSGTKNLIFCENQPHSGQLFRENFLSGLFAHHDDADQRIGLVDTVIHIMSRRQGDVILSEDYPEIPYDADAARGPMPAIPGLKPYHDFRRMDERKLFTHNLLHAAIGYAAHLRGIERVTQVGREPDIMDLVTRATNESVQGLARQYAGRDAAFSVGRLSDLRDEMLRRTLNALFDDSVTRLTRSPIRKLAPNERMVGAALLAEEHGVEPCAIATVIAHALHYDDPDDPESVEVQQRLHEQGVERVLVETCGLGPTSKTYDLVLQCFRQAAGWGGAR